jgi:hypothetical protein
LTSHKLSPNLQLKIKFLKESLRQGRVKFICAPDFRKDFVRIYESAQRNEANYGILMRGKVSVTVMNGEIFPVLLEVLDALLEENQYSVDSK